MEDSAVAEDLAIMEDSAVAEDLAFQEDVALADAALADAAFQGLAILEGYMLSIRRIIVKAELVSTKRYTADSNSSFLLFC
jgi:hypothetical protein